MTDTPEKNPDGSTQHPNGSSQELETGRDAYFLRPGYVQRIPPDYFVDEDEDGIVWQPDVYPYAAAVALEHGCDTVIDLGCGRAEKLAGLAAEHPSWHFIGVDYGANIEWCRSHWDFGEWVEADLEKNVRLLGDRKSVGRSVVICSDVLEHLVRPEVAVTALRALLLGGAARAVLSTPARERKVLPGQAEFNGPPDNRTHVREWASEEFCAFLRSGGLVIEDFSYTRRNDDDGAMTTQLILADADRS
ncbi:class I SAM-dependent methyltransferase [Streptomyces sp. NPDC050617]|uniref:class I SAM-dependent methyltransferase n=1 Tax=Streptomyces sp. NPDC050617 TaxID=3154628 RepID=UPI003449565A